jgi:hypothetical protein
MALISILWQLRAAEAAGEFAANLGLRTLVARLDIPPPAM